jgi:hypothetical protein
MKLTPEETRTLRREAHGKGNLSRHKLITVTDAGHKWVNQDDARVKKERASGGKLGGRPVEKKGKAQK